MLRQWRVGVTALIFLCCMPATRVFAADHAASSWQPTWVAAPQPSSDDLTDKTVRMIVRSSIAGDSVRIRIANTFGSTVLRIGSAHIALRDHDSAIAPASDRTLLFDGDKQVDVLPGASILSDPVALHVPELSEVAVSLYVQRAPKTATMHLQALRTNYLTTGGDHTADAELQQAEMRTAKSDFFLTGIYVDTSQALPKIVAFGDSITDGAHSTIDKNASWPSQLQALLLRGRRHPVLVLNEGIGGNRLVHPLAGFDDQMGVIRFDRDALAHTNIAAIVVLEGINDIGTTTGGEAPFDPEHPVTATELIRGMKHLIASSHLRGVKIYGGTLPPYAGARYYSPKGDAIRTEVNAWIRSSGALDGVVDFDRELEDPANKGRLLPAYDCGDHLHPSDAGYAAMANLVAKTLTPLLQ